MSKAGMGLLIIMVVFTAGCSLFESEITESTGTSQKEADPYANLPDSFVDSVKFYDSYDYMRVRDMETQSIIRCYRLSDTDTMFIVETGGYEEDMLISVRMNGDVILEVGVLYENESDKYGEFVTSDWFLDRFQMKNNQAIELVKRKKSHENEVIAITGATITSQAVVDAVNKCIEKSEDMK